MHHKNSEPEEAGISQGDTAFMEEMEARFAADRVRVPEELRQQLDDRLDAMQPVRLPGFPLWLRNLVLTTCTLTVAILIVMPRGMSPDRNAPPPLEYLTASAQVPFRPNMDIDFEGASLELDIQELEAALEIRKGVDLVSLFGHETFTEHGLAGEPGQENDDWISLIDEL